MDLHLPNIPTALIDNDVGISGIESILWACLYLSCRLFSKVFSSFELQNSDLAGSISVSNTLRRLSFHFHFDDFGDAACNSAACTTSIIQFGSSATKLKSHLVEGGTTGDEVAVARRGFPFGFVLRISLGKRSSAQDQLLIAAPDTVARRMPAFETPRQVGPLSICSWLHPVNLQAKIKQAISISAPRQFDNHDSPTRSRSCWSSSAVQGSPPRLLCSLPPSSDPSAVYPPCSRRWYLLCAEVPRLQYRLSMSLRTSQSLLHCGEYSDTSCSSRWSSSCT